MRPPRTGGSCARADGGGWAVPTPECRVLGTGGEQSPSPFPARPHLSIWSQLSDGFFTTAGMAGTGATLGPCVEQGSRREQHSPSPNSGQGAAASVGAPTCTPTPGAPRQVWDHPPPFPPHPCRAQGIPPGWVCRGGCRGVTRVVIHQVVQAGEGEPGRDVEPAVVQAVDAVVRHRVPGRALAAPHRQRVAA